MSGNHTPGPWTCDPDETGLFGEYRIHPACDADYHAGQDVANARLIAAAPLMLEVLRIHRTNTLTTADMLRAFAPELALSMEREAEDMRAAIAKATGEVPP